MYKDDKQGVLFILKYGQNYWVLSWLNVSQNQFMFMQKLKKCPKY